MKPDQNTIKKMESLVREVTGVEEDFRTVSRKRELVQSRQLCMKILKEETTLSLAKIGKEYKKDHATVLHAVKTIDNIIETNKQLREQYLQLFENAHELFVRTEVKSETVYSITMKILDRFFLDMSDEETALYREKYENLCVETSFDDYIHNLHLKLREWERKNDGEIKKIKEVEEVEVQEPVREELAPTNSLPQKSEDFYLKRIKDLSNEVSSLKRSLTALQRIHKRESLYTVNYNR